MRELFSAQAKKAWIAGASAALAVLVTGAPDGLVLVEYLTAAGAFVAAVGAVFGVTNKPSV